MTDNQKVERLFSLLSEMSERQQRQEQRHRLYVSFALGAFFAWLILLLFSCPAFPSEPIQGTYLPVYLNPGIVLDEETVTSTLCHRGGWAINPSCCCTHNWCHPVPCDRIDMRTRTLRVFPGDHPRIISHVIWENIPSERIEPSPDPLRCYLCASGVTMSCLLVQFGVGM